MTETQNIRSHFPTHRCVCTWLIYIYPSNHQIRSRERKRRIKNKRENAFRFQTHEKKYIYQNTSLPDRSVPFRSGPAPIRSGVALVAPCLSAPAPLRSDICVHESLCMLRCLERRAAPHRPIRRPLFCFNPPPPAFAPRL